MTSSTTGVTTDPSLFTNASAFEDQLDFAELRADRKAKVLAAMREADIDVLFLGREANARYVSGAEREWLAGTRPFAPTCVLTKAGAVHLMAFHAGRAGIAAEMPSSNVFQNTWNPMVFAENLRQIDGVTDAARIGVDGFTPGWYQLLALVAPDATIVGAQAMLDEVRAVKSATEVHCIRRAAAIAEGALTEATLHLAPGVSELSLMGRFRWRMSQLGTTQFGPVGSFTQVDEDAPLRWFSSERTVTEGSLVAMHGGVQWFGYEGSVGRTWWCGQESEPDERHRALFRRWRAAMTAMLEVCAPGGSTDTILKAHEAVEAPPQMALCHSIGLGAERTLVQPGAPMESLVLQPGMVLGLRTAVAGPGGTYFGEDMVLITETGHEVLTKLSYGPLATER